MSEKNGKEQSLVVPILVAIIGTAGTLGTAIFANWDKIFSKPSSPVAPNSSVAASPTALPSSPVTPNSSVAASPTALPSSPVTPNSSVVASPTASPSVSLSASPSQTPETSPVSRLAGKWSSEGDVRATHIMKLDISYRDNKLGGTLTSASLKSESSSGLLSIIGEINTKPVNVEIFDQKGNVVGKAELSLEDKVLVWRLIRAQGIAERALPSLSYLYPVN